MFRTHSSQGRDRGNRLGYACLLHLPQCHAVSRRFETDPTTPGQRAFNPDRRLPLSARRLLAAPASTVAVVSQTRSLFSTVAFPVWVDIGFPGNRSNPESSRRLSSVAAFLFRQLIPGRLMTVCLRFAESGFRDLPFSVPSAAIHSFGFRPAKEEVARADCPPPGRGRSSATHQRDRPIHRRIRWHARVVQRKARVLSQTTGQKSGVFTTH